MGNGIRSSSSNSIGIKRITKERKKYEKEAFSLPRGNLPDITMGKMPPPYGLRMFHTDDLSYSLILNQ